MFSAVNTNRLTEDRHSAWSIVTIAAAMFGIVMAAASGQAADVSK